MRWLRSLAFLLGGAGLALCLVAAGLALVPPNPDCGDQTAFYCEREAYSDRAHLVLLAGVFGVGLMVAGVGCIGAVYVKQRQQRAAQPAPKPTRHVVVHPATGPPQVVVGQTPSVRVTHGTGASPPPPSANAPASRPSNKPPGNRPGTPP